MSPQTLVEIEHLAKHYPLGVTAGQQLSQVWARLRGKEPTQVYKALQDVNLRIEAGQSTGLIGINGAGKSTLLKMIAGVVRPTHGVMRRRGTMAALLELGAGFQPDYTGRENIHLACALMGMSRAQIQSRLDHILDFADIGDHIDQPIKHYSSGMVVRLGFAVATSLNPDLLITDEVLAVGDESFQKKCTQWLEKYLANGGTLLLCSHSMYHVQKLCQQAIWIDEGRVRLQGESNEVTRQYLAWHEDKNRAEDPNAKAAKKAGNGLADKAGIYHVKAVTINGFDSVEPVVLPAAGNLCLIGCVHSPDGRTPQVAVGVVRADGTPVYGVVSEMDQYVLQPLDANTFGFAVDFERLPLLPGRYLARVHALDPEGMRLFDHVERPFEITGASRELGFCRLEHVWQPASHNTTRLVSGE